MAENFTVFQLLSLTFKILSVCFSQDGLSPLSSFVCVFISVPFGLFVCVFISVAIGLFICVPVLRLEVDGAVVPDPQPKSSPLSLHIFNIFLMISSSYVSKRDFPSGNQVG